MNVTRTETVYDVRRGSNNEFTVQSMPDIYEVDVTPYQVVEVQSALNFVYDETPVGAMNGSNATFTSEFEFVPESVEVLLNGIAQTRINDFNTSGTQTIILTVSPISSETLRINYQRA